MVPLFIDNDVSDIIIDGLVSHFTGIDLIRAREIGLADADDSVLLEWAAVNKRVLISSDEQTMVDAASLRLQQRLPMPGCFIVQQSLEYKTAIEDLACIALCSEPHEWTDLIVFLPLGR